MAPEIHGEPAAATPASDLFSVGLVLHELFTGERPFKTPTELFEQKAVFAVKPSSARPELPKGFDAWLQKLCTFEPGDRPSAAWALTELKILLDPSAASAPVVGAPPSAPSLEPTAPQLDYSNLLPNTQLTPKYVIEKRLPAPSGIKTAANVMLGTFSIVGCPDARRLSRPLIGFTTPGASNRAAPRRLSRGRTCRRLLLGSLRPTCNGQRC
jgi:serine/threonine protein kinase